MFLVLTDMRGWLQSSRTIGPNDPALSCQSKRVTGAQVGASSQSDFIHHFG